MAEKTRFSWITPLKKQCWVTLGVSLNMAQMGMVIGFSSVLVPQLRLPGSAIPIDDNYGSWIASIPAIALMIGNLIIPSIMGKFGRKIANLITLALFTISWMCIALCNDVTFLLVLRCLQGIAMGMVATLGPLLIGEYTSPTKRGAFLMSISLFIAFGVMFVQTLGSYLGWKMASLVCICLTIFNSIIIFTSPESPSWLSDQCRYDECKTTFRWLRGDTEEDELTKMIAASMALRKTRENEETSTDTFKTKLMNNIRLYKQTVKKNEFYKPFLIMVHIYAMGHWSGVNLLASYAVDFIVTIVGTDVNVPITMLSLNLTRILSNLLAVVLIQKVKRRTLMFSAVGMNAGLMFIIAAFTYINMHNLVQYDNTYKYYIGIALIHILTFFIAIGALPLSFILAGEVFPLRYKSMAGGISCLFFSLNLFLNIKTIPFQMSTINVYGLYLLHGGFLIYLLIVVGFMLPETKDKTLQDIEEEFTGKNCKKEIRISEKV